MRNDDVKSAGEKPLSPTSQNNDSPLKKPIKNTWNCCMQWNLTLPRVETPDSSFINKESTSCQPRQLTFGKMILLLMNCNDEEMIIFDAGFHFAHWPSTHTFILISALWTHQARPTEQRNKYYCTSKGPLSLWLDKSILKGFLKSQIPLHHRHHVFYETFSLTALLNFDLKKKKNTFCLPVRSWNLDLKKGDRVWQGWKRRKEDMISQQLGTEKGRRVEGVINDDDCPTLSFLFIHWLLNSWQWQQKHKSAEAESERGML